MEELKMLGGVEGGGAGGDQDDHEVEDLLN